MIFQPFSSPDTHKLITKILQHTKNNIFFATLTKKIGTILIHSYWVAIVMLTVVIFKKFDNLAGVSNLLASLGHTGRRRVVLGQTLNTQTLTKTGEQKTVLSKFTILC